MHASNQKQFPVKVPSMPLTRSAKHKEWGYSTVESTRRASPSETRWEFSSYEELASQNRLLNHPPSPFVSPTEPELEAGGGSANTVFPNNPSSPVGSSGGKNLCLLSTISSSPSPSRERTGADPARRNGFILSFGEGFVGIQSIASGSPAPSLSSDGGRGF